MAKPRLLSWPAVVAVLVASDVAGLALGLAIAYLSRFMTTTPGSALRLYPLGRDSTLLLIPPLWLGALWRQRLYRRPNLFSGIDEYRRVFVAHGVTVLLVVVLSYFTRQTDVSRGFLVLALLCVATFICLGRFAIRRALYGLSRHGRSLTRVVVLGANRHAVSVARQLRDSPSATTELAGFLSEYHPLGSEPLAGVHVLGEPLQLVDVAARVEADTAVVVESGLSWESLQHVVHMMHSQRGPQIVMVPSLYDLHATAMAPRQLGPVLALAPRPARIVGADAFVKRVVDLVVGGVATMVSLPLLAAMMLASIVAGQGPGLVRESFVDGRGKFSLWRFSYPLWAARAHFSRLPSLVLVLRGRMSLLGPRPVPADRAAEYTEVMTMLESAKPGFIGPWWLVGRGHPTSVQEELAYDLHYLRNYTIWFDLQILIHAARGLRGTRTYHPVVVEGEALADRHGRNPAAGAARQ